jgi:hypothetical protein
MFCVCLTGICGQGWIGSRCRQCGLKFAAGVEEAAALEPADAEEYLHGLAQVHPCLLKVAGGKGKLAAKHVDERGGTMDVGVQVTVVVLPIVWCLCHGHFGCAFPQFCCGLGKTVKVVVGEAADQRECAIGTA